MKMTTITQAAATTPAETTQYFDLLCFLQWHDCGTVLTYLDSPHAHDTLEYVYYTFAGTLTYHDEANHAHISKAGSAQLISPLVRDRITLSDDFRGLICGFDPELMPSLATTPLFHDCMSESFPLIELDELSEKTVLGPGSPIPLAIDCHLYEVTLEQYTKWRYPLEHNRHCGILLTQGNVSIADETDLNAFDCRFFSAVSDEQLLTFTANEHTHLFAIDIIAQR